jgi:hypothetical protein
MANEYLTDIHNHITEKIKSAEGLKVEEKFQEGRIRALVDFKDYLAAHFNSKLPRRIRLSLEDQ